MRYRTAGEGVWYVQSESHPETEWKVFLKDGKLMCYCPAFCFGKGERHGKCKHTEFIESIRHNEVLEVKV